MKLIPASSARWMMRIESSWSALPHAPNIIVPRHSGETRTPVRPNGRYSIPVSCLVVASGRRVTSPAAGGRAPATDATRSVRRLRDVVASGDLLGSHGGEAVVGLPLDQRQEKRHVLLILVVLETVRHHVVRVRRVLRRGELELAGGRGDLLRVRALGRYGGIHNERDPGGAEVRRGPLHGGVVLALELSRELLGLRGEGVRVEVRGVGRRDPVVRRVAGLLLEGVEEGPAVAHEDSLARLPSRAADGLGELDS